mgnify:CR=1 FL=1
MKRALIVAFALVAGFAIVSPAQQDAATDLSPVTWKADYDRFMLAQVDERTEAGVASGMNGAVTVAYNGLAARAGLEALKQGGNAMDAAMTTVLTQVALTAGAPISYFGILSLVYYDAESGRVHTMNAEWNTVLGEDDPLSIPGAIDMSSPTGIYGTAVSGRTALVGGLMKGVGAAHDRFGALPWDQIFQPAIYVAQEGMPISHKMAGYFANRDEDLRRLPETRATFIKEDGGAYQEGDVLRQPALATTLQAVAEQGTDYMYGGPWAEKLVAAVQAEGGKMTMADLTGYDVIWDEPLVASVGEYEIYTNKPPNDGGVSMIQAQRLARAANLLDDGHWTESGEALRKALDITQMYILDFLPEETIAQIYPSMDFANEARVTPDHAAELWGRMEAGAKPFAWVPQEPQHSDDVVVIDAAGNIAAITHSINSVMWGKTGIVIDGVTIGDPASFQQAQVALTEPGGRLPAPTETGMLFRDGQPVLGFASMGSGLHHRTFQGLLNVMEYGMTVDEAINSPDFFSPTIDPSTFQVTANVVAGRFPASVLEAMGYAYVEVDPTQARLLGEGVWVAISRDPVTGELRAASHNRNNSAAVAY